MKRFIEQVKAFRYPVNLYRLISAFFISTSIYLFILTGQLMPIEPSYRPSVLAALLTGLTLLSVGLWFWTECASMLYQPEKEKEETNEK